MSSRLRGFVPIGYQASPSRAVRRIAGPLSPPTQIGTRFCTGRGWKKMFENSAYLPLKLGFSLVHSSRQTAIVSSVTAPRSSNGSVPIASNSSRHQPTPMPQVNRPSDSTSIVAMILAVSTGGRCGTTVTEVTSRSFEVLAATKATAVSCSCRSPPARPGNSPVSEYGYFASMSRGIAIWSEIVQ